MDSSASRPLPLAAPFSHPAVLLKRYQVCEAESQRYRSGDQLTPLATEPPLGETSFMGANARTVEPKHCVRPGTWYGMVAALVMRADPNVTSTASAAAPMSRPMLSIWWAPLSCCLVGLDTRNTRDA